MGKKVSNEMTAQQMQFCNLFVTKEFFGNGTEAYIEAYGIDLSRKGAYEGARASASRLLTNANILKYLDKLLDNEGLNDTFVDKQLLFILTQNADFGAKIQAIKEYNKLRQRITDKIELKGEVKNFIIELTDETNSQTDKGV